MLIDKNISTNNNGELIINLRPYVNVKIKLGSWSQGLPFFLEKRGAWVRNKYKYRLALVTQEHLNNKSLPVYQYLEQFPFWIIEKVECYQYMQFLLLQLLSRNDNAKDLFKHSPNLLWLMVIEKQNKQWSDERLELFLTQNRQTILNGLYYLSDKKIVKFINKIELKNSYKRDYKLILRAIKSPQTIVAFYHWQTIPVYILALVEKYSNLLGCCVIEETIKQDKVNFVHCINEYREIHYLIIDMQRMAEILCIEDFKFRYKKLKTKQSIKNMHDRLIEKINKDPISSMEYHIGFPDSPLKGNENIILIKNSYELKLEGHELSHCVGSFVDLARQGQTYFYKVLKPERGTLQIKLKDGGFIIDQFKLKTNAEPSEASWKLAKQWLNK